MGNRNSIASSASPLVRLTIVHNFNIFVQNDTKNEKNIMKYEDEEKNRRRQAVDDWGGRIVCNIFGFFFDLYIFLETD